MNPLSSKTAALSALIALGTLMSTSAHANILRTVDGTPVRTTEGNCVLTGTDGDTGCPMVGGAAQAVDSERVVYFDFNKSTLTPRAKHHLDHLAWRLHQEAKHGNHSEIVIVGYADRIGNASYNEKLAMKRAQSVRDYLSTKGIKPKRMEVRSLGKTDPKANCPADLPRKKLIACLREDRRVEIEFTDK